MAYKDKDKQREAQRDWVRQKRAEKGSTEQGSTEQEELKARQVIAAKTMRTILSVEALVAKPKRGKDINVFADLPPDAQEAINSMSAVDSQGRIDPTIKANRTAQGNIRVSKPGDDDYVPQCETTRAFIEGRDKRPKRGKDINVFADLPLDVQMTISRMADNAMDKANRTAIAIYYQHLFPDRYNSTGVA